MSLDENVCTLPYDFDHQHESESLSHSYKDLLNEIHILNLLFLAITFFFFLNTTISTEFSFPR